MGRNLTLIRPETTGTSEFLALKLRLIFKQHGGQEELKGVFERKWSELELKEFAPVLADDRN